MAEAAGLLTESVAATRVVQGFGMEGFEVGRFRAALERLLRADLKAARATALAPANVGAVVSEIAFALFSTRFASSMPFAATARTTT